MENASKALIMAAGILIGILILSLAVYLFASFGANSKEIYDRIEQNQLTQYNAQYNVFLDRKDITIYEIISVANLAAENNKKYELYTNFETDYKVQVIFNAPSHFTTNLQDIIGQETQSLIDDFSDVATNEAPSSYVDVGELRYRFNCYEVEYNKAGRVCRIFFGAVSI